MAQRILPRREAGPGPPTRNNAPHEATKGCGRSSTHWAPDTAACVQNAAHARPRPPGAGLCRAAKDSTSQTVSTVGAPLSAAAQGTGPGQARHFRLWGWEPGRGFTAHSLLWPCNLGQGLPGPCNLRGEATASGKHCLWDEAGNQVAWGTLGQGRSELGCHRRLAGRGRIRAAGREVEGGWGGTGALTQRARSDHGENACLAKPEEDRVVGRRGEDGGLAQVPDALLPLQGSNLRPRLKLPRTWARRNKAQGLRDRAEGAGCTLTRAFWERADSQVARSF